jgi:DNA-binding transcriptional LysR family regulator
MKLPLSKLKCTDQLRGFVAVGRRMSITKAAEDLYLTQSAVSRQINTLEELLEVKLFQRGHRSIAFTPEGERLFRVVDAAYRQIQDVLGELAPKAHSQPVTVTSSIGVASLWLLPRLGQFQNEHPSIEVRITSLNAMLDLQAGGVDLAIRYSAGSNVPPDAMRLFGESIVPVVGTSSDFVGRGLADLIREHGLLELDDAIHPWLQWSSHLARMGHGDLKPKRILRFNQYDQLIQAAIHGQGLALGRMPLVHALLAEGHLSAPALPSSWVAETDHAYWLIRAQETSSKDVALLADWIVAEAKRLPAGCF